MCGGVKPFQGQRDCLEEMTLSVRGAVFGYLLITSPGATWILLAQSVTPTDGHSNLLVTWFQHPYVITTAFSGFIGGVLNICVNSKRKYRIRDVGASVLTSTILCAMVLPAAINWLVKDADVLILMLAGFLTGASADRLFPRLEKMFENKAATIMDKFQNGE